MYYYHQLIAAPGILVVAFIIGSVIHVFAGMAIGVPGLLLLAVIMSATQTIFLSAIYYNITNEPVKHFCWITYLREIIFIKLLNRILYPAFLFFARISWWTGRVGKCLDGIGGVHG
jgi:hypothetical protein